MEQAPKDTIESASPFEELEEDSEKKYLFDAKVLRGKESFDAIGASVSADSHEALPEYDNLHTKQKLLLSHIKPELTVLSTVQQPKPGSMAHRFISIDAHGLEIGGKTFDYDHDTRSQIHRSFVKEIIGDAQSGEEVYKRLSEANTEFHSLLRGRAEAAVRSAVQKEYDEKRSELKAEIQGRYHNISAHSLREVFIASLKPDFDDDTVKNVTLDIEQEQSIHKKQQDSLSSYYSFFERSEASVKGSANEIKKGQETLARLKARLAEAQREYDRLIAAGVDDGRLKKAKTQLNYREAKIKEKEQKLEELQGKSGDTISNSNSNIKGMNDIFAKVDTTIAKYDAIEQLSKMLQKPADSPEVKEIIARIENKAIEEDEDYYQIASKYYLEVSRIKGRNYAEEIAGKEGIVHFHSLSEALEKKQKAAFSRHNRLYNNLSEEETKQLLNQDFAAEYERRKKEYAMEHGNLTSQEYDVIQRSRLKRFNADSSVNALVSKYCDYHDNISQTSRANLDYAMYVLHAAVLNDVNSKLDKSSLRAPREVQVRVFDKYRGANSKSLKDRESNYSNPLSKSVRKDLNVADAKKQILSILSPKDEEQLGNYTEQLEQIIADIRTQLDGDVRYYDTLARFGSSLCQDDAIELKNGISRLDAEKEANLKSLPEDRVVAEEEKEMRDFSNSLFGEDIDEVFVYPTGFVIIDKDGRYNMVSIDVSSDSIAKRISSNKQDLWRSYLRGEEMNNPHNKQVILASVNEIIESDYSEYLDYATDEERDVADFCREYQIEQPATISTVTGSLNEQLFSQDCDNAKYCLEHFGRYIDDIDSASSSVNDVSDDLLKTSVKDFLADGSRIGSGFYGSYLEDDQALSIKRYTAVAEKLGHDAADSLLIDSISSGVYIKNEKNLEPILRKILGDSLNISVVTAMRLTGKKIISSATRQKVAMRALFTSSYNRYLSGKEIDNPQLAQLIERIDHIEYGQ